MIDSPGSERCADLEKILATRKQLLQKADYNRVIQSFPTLYHEGLKQGYVSEQTLHQHGFPTDLDMFENPVEKPTSISLEHQHWAKCLYHPFVVQQRRERMDMLRQELVNTVAYEVTMRPRGCHRRCRAQNETHNNGE